MCDWCVSGVTDAGSLQRANVPGAIVGGVTVPPVKKLRIDTALAERGLFPSRTAAAGAVRAGEVRIGADGPMALQAERAGRARGGADRRRAPPLRIPRRDQARQRARRAWDRGRRPRLPRRRRLDRGLHGLPPAARRRAGDRPRRRPRPARPRPAPGPAGDGDRAPQRPPAGPGRACPSPRSSPSIDVSFISLAKVLPASTPAWRRAARSWRWSSRSSSWAASGSVAGAWCEAPPTAATRFAPSAASLDGLGLRVGGLASSGLPGPKGNLRDLRLVRALACRRSPISRPPSSEVEP